MKKEIALIGYGRFGSFAVHYLQRRFSVGAYDIHQSVRLEPGIRRLSLHEAAKTNIIILSVPIGTIKPLLKTLAPLLQPKTLIIDVCSVKELPIQWMKRILPEHSYILGTHPLFGPDSVKNTLRGKPIALFPVRIPALRFRKIINGIRKTGMVPFVMTPQEHDRLIAKTLFLTQFVGRGISQCLCAPEVISTENYKLLLHIATASMKDTQQLFSEMYRYNRYTRHLPQTIIRQFQSLASTLPHHIKQ